MKKFLMLLVFLFSCSEAQTFGTETEAKENLYPVLTTRPFIFIRHGATIWNDPKLKLIQGSTDIPLNEEGRKQAREAGEILKGKGIKKIVSSNLSRARETAEIIHDILKPEKPITCIADLGERNWGNLEGTPSKGKDERFAPDYKPEGGEGLSAFRARVMKALLQVINKDEEGILIVAHDGVYRTLMDFIDDPQFDIENAIPLRFTPPSEDQKTWKVELIQK